MKECVTHHFSCDCREEMIKKLCMRVIFTHEFEKKFGDNEDCQCDLCQTARKLYPELDEK